MKNLHINPPFGCPAALSKKIGQLNNKLDLFGYAPTDAKAVQRMATFAADPQLVLAVVMALDEYTIIPTTPEELELFRATGSSVNYDIPGFWYCIALLAQSTEACAQAYLLRLARLLMEQGPGELHILRRIVLLLPEQPQLQQLNNELAAYYEKIFSNLAAYQWMKEVGIPYPDMWEWNISFDFTSDGEPFPPGNQTREQGQARFTLSVRMFSPRSLYWDYTRHTSYQISLRNEDNSIHGQWDEKDGHLIQGCKWWMKDTLYKPQQLAELFAKLEKFGIRFVKSPVSMYVTKGIRRAAIKKWIDKLENSLDNAPRKPKDSPEGTMVDGKERIAGRISRLRNELRESASGHLPMAERLELLYHLGDCRIVQKIMCECCKKVYPLWVKHVALSPELTHLLYDINEWAYRGTGDAEALKRQASHLQNYVHYLMSERKHTMSGCAVITLGYCLTEKAGYVLRQDEDEYDENEDDFDLDPETWLPDYEAELGYTDSDDYESPSSATLRREFWEWYLDTVQTLYDCPDREILPPPVLPELPEKVETFHRRQPEVKSNIVYGNLLQIRKRVLGYLPKELAWTKVEVNFIDLSGIYLRIFVHVGDEVKTVSGRGISEEICKLTGEIKETMYRLAPEEGAWIQLIVTLTPDSEPQAEYNYDNPAMLDDFPYNPEDFAVVFEEYPRSRLFTPAWWQALLPHDAKFLIADREKASMLRIDLTDGVLHINGTALDIPVSPGALVRAFGEEKTARGCRIYTDYEGRTDTYAPRTCLIWHAAGIVAARDDEDYRQIAAIYLQMKPRTEQDTTVPPPADTFCGEFTVNGEPFHYCSGAFFRSGAFEVSVTEDSKGYVEIACLPTRDRQDSWHNYTEIMEVCRQAALDDQDHIRTLERAEQRGHDYHEGTPNKTVLPQLSGQYLAHVLEAIRSGYASGRSERYLGSAFLSLMADAALKRYDYGSVTDTDLLFIFSACILLGYDKSDLKKLAERLTGKGVRDFMFDTLIHYKIEDWGISGTTAFPELKEWLMSRQQSNYENMISTLQPFLPDAGQRVVVDALLKIIR